MAAGDKFGPSGLDTESALEDIKAMLNEGKEFLTTDEMTESLGLDSPLTVKLYTHINADGTVDGELRFMKIPEDLEINQLITILGEGGFKSKRDIWSSVGVRFGDSPFDDLDDMKERYDRFKGLNQVSSYFRRFMKRNFNEQLLTAKIITDGLEAAERERPQQIYIRFHWNKENRTPKYRYGRRTVKEEETE